ncbi:MAG TPA: BPSS1780 family membrane protein [Xanthomonadaceae bacterium]|nr:BPSS1780 family membrane protein [Xanthomonadaceae bacterium]
MTSNPYEAPRAVVADYVAPGDSGDFLGEPRSCRAGRAVSWFGDGWNLFSQSPGIWILIFLVFMGLMLVSSLVPFFGMLAQNILFPILTAGVVVGCDAMRRGEPLEFQHLFTGFSRNSGALVLLGLLYTVAVVVVLLLAFVPTIGLAGGIAFIGGDEAGLAEVMGLGFLLGMLVWMALLMPLVMCIWFAPHMVIMHDKQPLQAMRLSFFACLKNILPFLLYGLIAAFLAIAATIPLLLGWLVVGPWFYTSTYMAYRDIFFSD